MAFRLQQIEIKRWHDAVNLHVNQLAYLVSNFFHRHPTSNMRQDIWPAIWENDAAQHSWTIHYIILVFLSAVASSHCASLIKLHFWRGCGDRLCSCLWVKILWMCRTSARDNIDNITLHIISYHWRMSLFGFLRGGEGRFCLIVCKWIHCGCIWRPLVTRMYWERRRKAVAGRSWSERGSAGWMGCVLEWVTLGWFFQITLLQAGMNSRHTKEQEK